MPMGCDAMNKYQNALALLPPSLADRLCREESVEEIRLRLGKRPGLIKEGREWKADGPPTTRAELERVLEKATGASFHLAAASLEEGYLPVEGLRIGVCGFISQKEGRPRFRSIHSLAIRIPRECPGICRELMESIYADGFESTLLLSPPGGGKTTALRELSRCLSQRGCRVALVDERNELSASDSAGTGFDLGENSDVLVGMTKAEGAMMLLRAMNPEILAMDEITSPRDLEAIRQLTGCGVRVLATAHGSSMKELQQRPLYRELLALQAFRYAVVICGSGRERRYVPERILP